MIKKEKNQRLKAKKQVTFNIVFSRCLCGGTFVSFFFFFFVISYSVCVCGGGGRCRHPVYKGVIPACSKISKRSIFCVLSRTIFDKLPPFRVKTRTVSLKKTKTKTNKQTNKQTNLSSPIQGHFSKNIHVCAKTRTSFKGQYFQI